MDIRNRRALKQEAAAALDAAPYQKKIIAVYAGVCLLFSLVVALLDFFLSSMIEGTSGLSNIGNRIILQTAQTVLPIVQLVFLLLWQYGYTGTVMAMSRHRIVDHRELTGGFRCFGPIARLTLLQYLISFGLSFASVYLSSMVFLCTPYAQPLYKAMAALLMDTTMNTADIMADPGIAAAMYDSVLPIMVIFLVIYCLLVLPITFLFRMSPYCLLDKPQAGAFAALKESRNMMRRNRLNLLKLDLSFWWYYLLSAVTAAISYIGLLLPTIGISLPLEETASDFLFYGLYLAAQFLLSYFFRNRLEVTYVKAYEALKPRPPQNGVVLGNIFQM